MTLRQDMATLAISEAMQVATMDFMWQAPWEKKRRPSRAGFKGATKYRVSRKLKNKAARKSRKINRAK